MARTRKEHATEVANRLIEQLEKGTAPFQIPWSKGKRGSLPHNGSTGRRYKGANAIWLAMQNRQDPRWFTFNQIAKDPRGLKLMKGSKSVKIEFWQFTREEVDKETGKKKRVRLERPFVKYHDVWNAEQIQGLTPWKDEPEQPLTWDPIERVESLLKQSGADIRHGGDEAYYSPIRDHIQMPDKQQFAEPSLYYATALHELGHWTGHSSRLDRDLTGSFGSESYAKEELRAEISSMLLGEELGIGHDGQRHASYVQSWIKALKNDPQEIFRASADAEKITTFVMGFEQALTPEQEVDLEEDPEQRETIIEAIPEPRAAMGIPVEPYVGTDTLNSKLAWCIDVLEATDSALPFNTARSVFAGLERKEDEELGRVFFNFAGMPMAELSAKRETKQDLLDAMKERLGTWPRPEGWDMAVREHVRSIQAMRDVQPKSVEGYRPLDSFQDLREAAQARGWEPRVTMGEGFDIAYWKDGVQTPVTTSMGYDGKCLTKVNGARVPMSSYTSEAEDFNKHLNRAIDSVESKTPLRQAPSADPVQTYIERAMMIPADWNQELSLQPIRRTGSNDIEFAKVGEEYHAVALYVFNDKRQRTYLGDVATIEEANAFVGYLKGHIGASPIVVSESHAPMRVVPLVPPKDEPLRYYPALQAFKNDLEAGKTQAVDHHAPLLLDEYAAIRRGEHPSVAPDSDRVAHAEYWERTFGMTLPRAAEDVGRLWHHEAQAFSDQSGLSPDRVRMVAGSIAWEGNRELSRQKRPLVASELSGEWSAMSGQLMGRTRVWPNQEDAQHARAELAQAQSSFAAGKWDLGVEALSKASAYEALQEGPHRDTAIADLAIQTRMGWETWQKQQGLGPSITPEKKAAFEAIPKDLSVLAPGMRDEMALQREKAKALSPRPGRGRSM